VVEAREVVDEIYILLGNHDYLREGHAYFEFLGRLPGVHFITHPWDDAAVADEGPVALFLPYTKNHAKDWQALSFADFSYVFMHQTAPGAVASNGQKMDGEKLPSMKGPKVYSGDIHVPQVLGDIEYIGSPYHVHFGDRFKPRCILLDRRNRPVDLHFPTISRLTLTVESLRELKRTVLTEGDQVKLRIKLTEADKHDWHRVKREAAAYLKGSGVEIHDIELLLAPTRRAKVGVSAPQPTFTEEDAVVQYVVAEELGADALDMGLELVK